MGDFVEEFLTWVKETLSDMKDLDQRHPKMRKDEAKKERESFREKIEGKHSRERAKSLCSLLEGNASQDREMERKE